MIQNFLSSVDWGCRIHWLFLCRRVTPPHDWQGYDIKSFDGEAQGIWSTTSLPSLPGPLWPEVVAPDKSPINRSNRTVWDHLTMCKRMSLGLFKNVINKTCLQIIYLIHMYKEDFALNNLQWLISHKTQPN